jgi:hypothetical protein
MCACSEIANNAPIDNLIALNVPIDNLIASIAQKDTKLSIRWIGLQLTWQEQVLGIRGLLVGSTARDRGKHNDRA